MTTSEELIEKGVKYHLLKITIEAYLKSYTETLVDFENELENYKELEMDSLVELKKEHCDSIRGKIELLTELNTK